MVERIVQMKALSLRLEPDQYQRLRYLSYVKDQPISEMIREAIELYLTTEQKIKPGQEWFWAEGWQTAEREVDSDLAAGNYETFDTMEDFLNGLK
jgi:predicted transcriptional regulator